MVHSKTSLFGAFTAIINVVILATSLAWIPSLSNAQELGCDGEAPLLTVRSIEFKVDPSSVRVPAFLGEWRLPISPQDPQIVTAASVRVELLRSESGTRTVLWVGFSYASANPWGLPFTFEKAELSWMSAGKRFSKRMDWSQNCSSPGRSLFPHQTWHSEIELSSDENLWTLESPEFRLWGSQN
jgi:hypothetical protein